MVTIPWIRGPTLDRKHLDLADQYVDDVLQELIPVCDYVKQACQRQRDDLERENFDYYFDEVKAARACQFISLLPHIKGKWAGSLIDLEPWQCFIIATLFGWVDISGLRRFKEAYIEVARKNAKSTLAAGIGLYICFAEGEPGAEVYSLATTRAQARIVWETAKRMVDQTSGLRRMGVESFAHSIAQDRTGSFFRAMSRDTGGNLDGLNVHGGLIDELHAHKTRDVYDVIQTATGAREQPLLISITTAGFNRAGICYEVRSLLIRLLDPGIVDVQDEETFGVIYTIDKGDDWTDEEVWKKANPNYGVSVMPDDIRRQARQAQAVASKQNNFLTKRLNVWVNADTAWMNMRSWDESADIKLDYADFVGEKGIVGLDLASKKDIAARVDIFRREIVGKPHFYAFAKCYLPEAAIEESGNAQYSGWEIEGHLIATPGNVTDYDWIERDLIADKGQVLEIAYDPHQATQIVTHLQDSGFTLWEFAQTAANYTEPMKEFEAAVLDGRFHFNGDPAYTWQISNVVCHTNAKDEIFPRKERDENKIDAAVATFMAFSRWLKQDSESHAYKNRGFREL